MGSGVLLKKRRSDGVDVIELDWSMGTSTSKAILYRPRLVKTYNARGEEGVIVGSSMVVMSGETLNDNVALALSK